MLPIWSPRKGSQLARPRSPRGRRWCTPNTTTPVQCACDINIEKAARTDCVSNVYQQRAQAFALNPFDINFPICPTDQPGTRRRNFFFCLALEPSGPPMAFVHPGQRACRSDPTLCTARRGGATCSVRHHSCPSEPRHIESIQLALQVHTCMQVCASRA